MSLGYHDCARCLQQQVSDRRLNLLFYLFKYGVNPTLSLCCCIETAIAWPQGAANLLCGAAKSARQRSRRRRGHFDEKRTATGTVIRPTTVVNKRGGATKSSIRRLYRLTLAHSI